MLTRHTARQQNRARLSIQIANALRNLEIALLAPAPSQHIIRRPLHRSISSARNTSPSRNPRACATPPQRCPAPSESWRSLATATDAHLPSHEAYIPFEGSARETNSSKKDYQSHGGDTHLWQRPPSDVFRLSPYADNETMASYKASSLLASPTEFGERLNHYYACLHVGRFDRARKLISDIMTILYPDEPEAVDVMEKYFEAQMNRLIRTPNRAEFLELQKYFELDFLSLGGPVTGSTLSSMAKAAMACYEGKKLDRTLRRYLAKALEEGAQTEQDMLSSSVFTDSELAHLTSLIPERFHNFPTAVNLEENEALPLYADGATLSQRTAYANSDAPGAANVPDLRSTEQKGLGLSSLKVSLSNLPNLVMNDHSDALNAQESLEKDVLEAAVDRWRNESESTQQMRARGAITGSGLGSHIYGWIQQFSKRLREELDRADSLVADLHYSPNINLRQSAPALRMMDPEKIAAATIVGFIGCIYRIPVGHSRGINRQARVYDLPLIRLWKNVGDEVLRDLQFEHIHSSDWAKRLKNVPAHRRKQMLAQMYKSNVKETAEATANQDTRPAKPRAFENNVDELNMTSIGSAKLGTVLSTLLMEVAKLPLKNKDGVTELQPIMGLSVKFKRGKRYNMIDLHQSFIDILKREPASSFIAKHLPMLVEPRPWKSMHNGGYLHSHVCVIRGNDSTPLQRDYIKIADSRGDMKSVYAALDVIGKVPWRINGPLLEVMVQVWNTGEGMANIVPENPEEVYPPEPSNLNELPQHERFRYKSICQAIRNEVTGAHSQRCYQNMQLEVAKALLNKDFYCPHSIDFRGRAYPIPPYLTHMGADPARGLFMFARGKPLGEIGLRWLKIHLANVFGYDKASLKEREQFANDHLTEIYDSAENPLGGKRWWLESEDCWQTLAACMELRNALESPVPSQFVSHLPVQQDGSCNGLQHYAALGGDEIGARQVNLAPGDRPADIYTAIADLVKNYVAEDAAKGLQEAKMVNGHISRKVVKQPVMTNVYGVTFIGAQQQVRKQLADILPAVTLDNKIWLGAISAYVASQIFKALGEMFNGAYAIQKWLGECGARISTAIDPAQIERIRSRRAGEKKAFYIERKAGRKDKFRENPDADSQFKSTIIWTTPLGLPVVQPYRDSSTKSIATATSSVTMRIFRHWDPINKRKQLQGFPPNFIHSLDATHMMLSALKCDEVGLQFASVHDSFWTHAADVPIMNRVLRDAFIQMHSEDIIGRLREEFTARYKGCMLWRSVPAASPLGARILELYATKKVKAITRTHPHITHEQQLDLMFEELERMRLLQSGDVEDQRRGREMVTAASLAENASEGDMEAVKGASPKTRGYAKKVKDTIVSGEDVKEDLEKLADAAQDAEEDAEQADLEVSAEDDDAGAGEPIEPSSAEDEMPKDLGRRSAPGASKGLKNAASWLKLQKHQAPQGSRGSVFFWQELSFPAPPQKGTFDVTQLKDSQYFFS